MAAMILSWPTPQFGQCCMSMSNTRLSSHAQLMRPGRARGPGSRIQRHLRPRWALVVDAGQDPTLFAGEVAVLMHGRFSRAVLV
jgi:hypothetical protein